MTNLVATTPITAKAMKSLYAELNRQKDLKRTYRQRYKDLQALVATTDTSATISRPVAITSSKVTPNKKLQKLLWQDKIRKHLIKEKPNPLAK